MKLAAVFSPRRIWRYELLRQWSELPTLVFIGLNPSTADESRDDPTIRRCIGFAMNAGYGGLMMLNLFGFRSTLPGSLLLVADPVGPGNDAALQKWISNRATFCCAWGNFPLGDRRRAELLGARVFAVCRMLRESSADVRALRLTSLGQPEHPLYLSSKLSPAPWNPL